MLHTVYKTTCLVNGKFYFGYHKTKNPSDSYLGSGTHVRRAVSKYGRVNFKKEVLFIYPDAESAFGKEKELIKAFLSDQQCMNLREGENGAMPEGFGETQRRLKLGKKRPAHVGAAVAAANRKRVGWRHSSTTREQMSVSGKLVTTPRGGQNKGVHHSQATKDRISASRKKSLVP